MGKFSLMALPYEADALEPVISRDTIEVTHVLGLGTLLLGQQRLVHLLTMTNTNHLNIIFSGA